MDFADDFLSLKKYLALEGIDKHIEALIFSAENPITEGEIKNCLEEVMDVLLEEGLIGQSIECLLKKYDDEEFSFGIYKVAGGYQFMTKGSFHNTIGTFLKQSSKKRLSKSALETLSIIAYKQPATKAELEGIRGVNCDYAIQKLLEKELIYIIGRSETVGKPLLYGTSDRFMEYFGLNSLAELPALKDFKLPDNQVGESESREELELKLVEITSYEEE